MNIDLMIIRAKLLQAQFEEIYDFRTAKTEMEMLIAKTKFAERCVQLLQDVFAANEADKRNDVAI